MTRNSVAYATCGYNALEQLTTRSTSAAGGQVAYIYDLEGHLIAEATASTGATTHDYIWMAANDNSPVDLPLAVADIVTTTSTLFMVHTDHLGRPIRMTDATKATVWRATYKPFGEVQTTSGTKANNLRFPGQYSQIETAYAHNWHRHYDPVSGRYTQPDPLRFVDGPSIYAYAGNSPWMKTDRSGSAGTPRPPYPLTGKGSSGKWIDCGGGCRIRIDTQLWSDGTVRRHYIRNVEAAAKELVEKMEYSLIVNLGMMRQKSSVLQVMHSVPRALKSDTAAMFDFTNKRVLKHL